MGHIHEVNLIELCGERQVKEVGEYEIVLDLAWSSDTALYA